MWPFSKVSPAKRNNFDRGYDHGKDCVKKGVTSELLQNIDTAKEFGEYEDFDRGAEKALREAGIL
jgi:hypothetical protein